MRKAAKYVGNIGRLGPAMQALPADNWRLFVYHLVTGPQKKGKLVRALLLAGFAAESDARTRAQQAHSLSRDDRVVAAICEETARFVRVAAPEAAHAVMNLIRDPGHKDHGRAIAMILDRVDPAISVHQVDVHQRHEHAITATPAVLERIEKLAQRFGLNVANMPALLDGPVIEATAEEVRK